MMDIGTIVSLIALVITVIANIIAIVIFLTRQSDNLSFLKQTFEESRKNVISTVDEYRNSMHRKFDEFKGDITKQIEQNQEHTKEHIKRLEEKQDKHNCLIERMVRVEASASSAHKRLDDMEEFQHEIVLRKG